MGLVVLIFVLAVLLPLLFSGTGAAVRRHRPPALPVVPPSPPSGHPDASFTPLTGFRALEGEEVVPPSPPCWVCGLPKNIGTHEH